MIEQIEIQGVHYTVSDTTIQFIEEKLSKIEYMKKTITFGTIRIIRDNDQYTLEADIHCNNKSQIHIDTTDKLLYPAIENLMHKLKHKLSDIHKKITSHHKHHGHSIHHSDGHPIVPPSDDDLS